MAVRSSSGQLEQLALSLIIGINFYMFIILCRQISAEIRGYQEQFKINETMIPKLLEVPVESRVLLYCNFWSNENNFGATNWYFKKRGHNKKEEEILPDMKNFVTKVKTYITPSHVLVMDKIQKNDSGIYLCKKFNRKDETLSIFVLDVTLGNHNPFVSGSINKWLQFKKKKVDTINYQIGQQVFESRCSNLFTITYCWDDWQSCKLNTRKRLGKCCVHPKRQFENKDIRSSGSSNFLLDEYDILCRSLILNETYPNMSRLVSHLPDFQLCESCNDRSQLTKSNSVITERSTAYKVKTIVRKIPEFGHLALACNKFPWSSNVQIQWFKNNKLLNNTFRKNMAAEEDPHLFIDSFNTLFILHATKNEHAIYTCNSNGVDIQKIDVRVFSTSNLLNQDFLRYSIYLAFVLSLTVTCYCAGICVAWHQRTSFADPLHISFNKD